MGEAGMLLSMLLGYALLFAGLGIFVQGWRELYRAHRRRVPMFVPRPGQWGRLFERPDSVARADE